MATKTDYCCKCGHLRPQTKHHIHPKRKFSTNAESFLLWICRRCHNGLESKIKSIEKRGGYKKDNKFQYWLALFIFFQTNEIVVWRWSRKSEPSVHATLRVKKRIPYVKIEVKPENQIYIYKARN